MVTMAEHLSWLSKHCDEVIVLVKKPYPWFNVYAKIGTKEFRSEDFEEGAEATRDMCDQVCDFLGKNCAE